MASSQVKSSEFKAKMAAHLRQVKKGEELILLDRDVPFAKVIPFRGKKKPTLKIIKAKKPGALKNMKFTGVKAKIDVVKLLREDRDRR
ncbi:MAG: hypothetical protein KDK66_03575 [Deltaproteobacteria bacterium]|nr:hypothetical protein [Deltaproteobacteria bacterium]